MSPELEDIIVDTPGKKAKEAVDIAKKMNEPTLFQKLETKFLNWLVLKGWIYVLVFIIGLLTGGLIWK